MILDVTKTTRFEWKIPIKGRRSYLKVEWTQGGIQRGFGNNN